jgi:hypothetical protein
VLQYHLILLLKLHNHQSNFKFFFPNSFKIVFYSSEMNGTAPNFIEKPSIKSDGDGKRLCFECKIKAEPEPKIQWFRNDVEIIDKGN